MRFYVLFLVVLVLSCGLCACDGEPVGLIPSGLDFSCDYKFIPGVECFDFDGIDSAVLTVDLDTAVECNNSLSDVYVQISRGIRPDMIFGAAAHLAEKLAIIGSSPGDGGQKQAVAGIFGILCSIASSLINKDMEEEDEQKRVLSSFVSLCECMENANIGVARKVAGNEVSHVGHEIVEARSLREKMSNLKKKLLIKNDSSVKFLREVFGNLSEFVSERLDVVQGIVINILLQMVASELGIIIPHLDREALVAAGLVRFDCEINVNKLGDDDSGEFVSGKTGIVEALVEATGFLADLISNDTSIVSRTIRYPLLFEASKLSSAEELDVFVKGMLSREFPEVKGLVSEIVLCIREYSNSYLLQALEETRNRLLNVNFDESNFDNVVV